MAVVPASTGSAIDTKWLGETPDPELKGYVENKGWKDPVELLNGYRNLEKLVGQARIAMPKDENDAEGYARCTTRSAARRRPPTTSCRCRKGGRPSSPRRPPR
jgi:hypothetical protein